MPRIVLPRDQRPGVLAGRQLGALMAPRANQTSNPFPRLGAPFDLDLPRTGEHAAATIAVRPCVLRASVVIAPDALVRVVPGSELQGDEAAGLLARRLLNAEQGSAHAGPEARDALAVLLGFETWADLYAWHSHPERKGRPDADGRVTRELVGWGAE